MKICEGKLLSPIEIAAFPNLFKVELATGKLKADVGKCGLVPDFIPNYCGTTEALVENTIQVLNLNCDRLCKRRLALLDSIQTQITQQRKKGLPLSDLVKRYFAEEWPEFFSTIRYRFGVAAERYLEDSGYQG